jgi:hypothetical protein
MIVAVQLVWLLLSGGVAAQELDLLDTNIAYVYG